MPLNERANVENILTIEQLCIVRGEPHITADSLMGIEVGIRGRLTLHIGEGLDVRLADVVMVCGGDRIHITNCGISCGRHMLADGEGVMRVVVFYRPRIEMLFSHIIERATYLDADFIPSLIVIGSLEGANHTLDYLFGYLAVAVELASLTFRETAGYEHTLVVAYTGPSPDFVKEGLATFGGEVGCVVDCGNAVVVGEIVKQASFEETEHFLAITDDVGVTVEFFADVVRGEYLTLYVVGGKSMLVFAGEC
jgi:hypothetical protein